MDWERDDHTRTCVEVYYNDRGLEWDDSGQLAMPKDIYNAPYARKGAILRALGWDTGVWGKREVWKRHIAFLSPWVCIPKDSIVQATLCGSGLPLRCTTSR